MFSNLSEDKIFDSEIHCFNYYPIGAPSIGKIGANASKFLGFEVKSKQAIYDYFDNQTDRKSLMKRFINDRIIARDKLLIVFGGGIRQKVIDLLSTTNFCAPFCNWSQTRNGKPSAIQWSTDKKIWLTGHPSYGWINEAVVDSMAKIRAGMD